MAEDVSILKQKAQEWAGKVVNLYNTPVPPELAAEKKVLLTTAKKIKDAIEYLTGPLTALAAMNQMQLGFIPVVVGVIGVAGAISAIVYWTTDYAKFVKKIEDRNTLIAAGMTPAQAVKAQETMHGKGSLFGIDTSKIIWGVGGLGLLYIFGKKQGWF